MRHDRRNDSDFAVPPYSEAWLFAQELLGNPIPDPQVAARNGSEDRAKLEWLAAISPPHAEELRRLENQGAEARRKRESLIWAAGICDNAAAKLRTMLREEAEAGHAGLFSSEAVPQLVSEWDRSQPRVPAGRPDGGQFASTGGPSGSGLRHTRQPRSKLEERSEQQIAQRSGNGWSGDRVLDALRVIAPGWLPFVKRHFTLAVTSGSAAVPSTTVRSGEYGSPISKLPKAPIRERGPLTVHVDVPAHWNDLQVAQHILKELADDVDVHRMAAEWSERTPKLFKEIQDERFRDGLSTVAALAGGYYTAIASLVPGGQAAVAMWDIHTGDNVGAALDVAFMLPLGKLAKAGIEASGVIALKSGERVIGVLPVQAIEKISKLAPDQMALLHKRLLTAKTEQEVAEITAKFLATPFDSHHPLAKFLGGHRKQLLIELPEKVHQEFHTLLREELRNVGLLLPIGGKTGSTQAWAKYFRFDPARQGKAFDAP